MTERNFARRPGRHGRDDARVAAADAAQQAIPATAARLDLGLAEPGERPQRRRDERLRRHERRRQGRQEEARQVAVPVSAWFSVSFRVALRGR